MINNIPMVTNPQTLVNQPSGFNKTADYEIDILLDAIFVPFRNRWGYVNDLLSEIRWYEGPIYLIPSNQHDIMPLTWDVNQNVQVLYPIDSGFTAFSRNLKTSKLKRTNSYCLTWDLPLKRNYILWYSMKRAYKHVLLIDDDIRQLEPNVLRTGSNCLKDYVLSGCFVEEYPDISIVGHLERNSGLQIHTFLSGSFLFIRIADTHGFFPNIYNEDWLFMLHHVKERSICSFGSISQLPYNPFRDARKASFQEFGEIIAEGLYALINANQYECRYEHQMWSNIIDERRDSLASLKRSLQQSKHQQAIDAAFHTNCIITPSDCLTFIENWESDTMLWASFLKEV